MGTKKHSNPDRKDFIAVLFKREIYAEKLIMNKTAEFYINPGSVEYY